MTLSRRTFVTTLATALPAASLIHRAHTLAVDHVAADARTMLALGEAVLPGELGHAGIANAVRAFQQWIAGYREGAELLHGYGTSKLGFAGPTPATKWAAQLDALAAKSFASLPLAKRRDLVRAELTATNATRLTSVGQAPHVAVALLAHWYGSPDATDRCYESRIGRQTCRPLAAQARKPLPLANPAKEVRA